MRLTTVTAVAAIAVMTASAAAAYEYRLVGPRRSTQGSSYYGRLEVRTGPTTAWGTVCNDFFGTTDARVACRSLGLSTSTVSYRTATTSERGSTSQSIIFDDLACSGTESTLDRCSRGTGHNCGHSEDIVVGCGYSSVPSFSPTAASTEWQYRLVGGSSTYGRLEVRPSSTGTWGTVCNDIFDASDALVACRSLGISATSASYRTASGSSEQGSSSQPIWMDNLACSSSEYQLDHCPRATTHNCGHNEDVWIACGMSSVPGGSSSATPAPASSWEYRLTGGSSANTGRLEARSSSSSTWGTVCDDGFGSTDAVVACRSLGMTYSSGSSYRTVRNGEYGLSSQPTVMDDLACTGTEARLDLCSQSSTENCAHSEDIWLTCAGTSATAWEYRLAGGTTYNGRLEARSSSSSTWGTVCDDGFDSRDAAVACRSLGHLSTGMSYRTVLTTSEQGSSLQPTVMDDLACTGSEARLDLCSQASTENCAHSEDIWLTCQPSSGPSTPTTTTTWQYRLVGGTTAGRLEARSSSSSSTWGTVCDDYFGTTDAQVACRSLGLTYTYATYRTVTTSERGSTSQPTVMDNLACIGNEATLDRCSRATSEDCSHSEDIYLSCPPSRNTATPSPPSGSAQWQYRLAGGGSNYGRLEVRPSSSNSWGTVCDDSFGSVDARVACRSLGFSTTTVAYRTASTAERGATSQSIWMDDLACTGSETSLDRCTRSSSHNCYHGEDVVLACGLTSVPSFAGSAPATPAPVPPTSGQEFEYRLVGGSSTHGRLEVRPVGTTLWGTVCDDSFGVYDARVACRSLGLGTTSNGYRTARTGEYGLTSQPIYMDNLACTGAEPDLHSCSRATGHNCVHGEDVILSCVSTTPGSATGSFVGPTVRAGVSGETPWLYRLVGGTSSTWGRLEAREMTSEAWGTVCDDSFGLTDARVACRSLGFPSTVVSYRSARVASEQGSTSQVVLMDDVACNGTEARLDQCTRSNRPADCTHAEDVILACGYSSVPGTVSNTNSEWSYRLVGGTSAASGRLEVRPAGSTTYGTVCDDAFGATDARVACRSLGYDSYSSYRTVRSTERGSSSQPIVMDDVACQGTERELRYCAYLASHNCGHTEDVYLACSGTASHVPATPAPPSVPWQYRLVGGDAPNSGRLEVYGPSGSDAATTGRWGTVCDDSFSRVDAIVACRSLGLGISPVRYATAAPAMRGSTSQPILMDDVSCSGSESRLDQCSRSARHNCGHHEDVVLTCGALAVPVRSQIRLGGHGWRHILASEDDARIATLRAAVQADIAEMLGIESASDVTINRMYVGSLVVDFEVNATSNDAALAMANTVNASEGRTFTRAQALYATQTPEGQAGETTTVANASAVAATADDSSAVAPDSPSAKSDEESSGVSIGLVAGVIVAIVIVAAFVAVVAWFLVVRGQQRRGQQQQQELQQQQQQRPNANANANHNPAPPTQQVVVATVDGAPGAYPQQHGTGVYDGYHHGQAQPQPTYPYPEPQQLQNNNAPQAGSYPYPYPPQQPGAAPTSYGYPPQPQTTGNNNSSAYGQPTKPGETSNYGYGGYNPPQPQPQYAYPPAGPQQPQQPQQYGYPAYPPLPPAATDVPAYPDAAPLPGAANDDTRV